MKKLISLVLVLALCMTAVSALATTGSSSWIEPSGSGSSSWIDPNAGGSGSGSGSSGSGSGSGSSASSSWTNNGSGKSSASPAASSDLAGFGDSATTTTKGLVIEPVSEESKKLVNSLVKGGNLAKDVYEKTIFVGDDAQPNGQTLEGKNLSNVILIPMPVIKVNAAQITETVGEIIVPVPVAIAEYLLKNIEDVIALFTYKVGDQLFTYEVAFEITQTSATTYGIIYKIPVEVLKAAQGCPSFMDFEIVK